MFPTLSEYFQPPCNVCVDVDECSTEEDICDENAECVNTSGSYECNCAETFFGNGQTCFPGSCSELNCRPADNKKCVSPTTIDCQCVAGYEFDHSLACVDTDECRANPCDKNADCTNNQGSFSCSCRTGFVGNGTSCSDFDECSTDSHGCYNYDANCTNTVGTSNKATWNFQILGYFRAIALIGVAFFGEPTVQSEASNALVKLGWTSHASTNGFWSYTLNLIITTRLSLTAKDRPKK